MEIICDFCKKQFTYKGGNAHFARSKSHYCSIDCLTQGNRIYTELHNKGNKRYCILCGAKKRARLKGQDFRITLDDIPPIPNLCPVLGIPIKANTTNAPLDSSPSLDRIDSTKGYIPGNVRIISNRANRIKADATLEELRRVVKDLEKIQHCSL